MLTHDQIWSAIDALAERHELTASALARKAGLDPTTFNKSKRATGDGRLRWPSTESLAKCLAATETSVEDFIALLSDNGRPKHSIPLMDFNQAGVDSAFDENGSPQGEGWRTSDLPAIADDDAYALEISSDDLLPLYRAGTTLIVSPAAIPRGGDRVVLKTQHSAPHIAELQYATDTAMTLKAPLADAPVQVIAMDDIVWMSRIIWASQ